MMTPPPHLHPRGLRSMFHVAMIICPLLCLSVSDAEGQMKVTEVATRPLSQDLLNHDVRGFSAVDFVRFFQF